VKITPIAAASIIPATVAGLAITMTTLATGAVPAAAAVTHARAAAHTRTVPAHRVAAAHPAAVAAKHPAVAATPPPGPKPAAAPHPAEPQISATEAAFEKCVAWRESGDNPTASSAGLFGILPATWAQLGFSGTAGQAPVSVQKAAFHKLYSELGTQPWAQYDGC
jgi:hypothetical protein